MPIKHIMLDIETLGLSENAVITQIAAAEFELDSYYIGKTFNVTVDINQKDRLIEAETLKWWLKQLPTTRSNVINTSSQFPLQVVLASLTSWIEDIGSSDNIKFWCRGVNFDFVLLDSAFRQYNLKSPWKYTNLADVRTFDSITPKAVRDSVARVGQHHNAIDDVYFQINYVRAALKWLNSNSIKR